MAVVALCRVIYTFCILHTTDSGGALLIYSLYLCHSTTVPHVSMHRNTDRTSPPRFRIPTEAG
jgi:hypothetical protein